MLTGDHQENTITSNMAELSTTTPVDVLMLYSTGLDNQLSKDLSTFVVTLTSSPETTQSDSTTPSPKRT